jgi:hypothetical protein
MLLRWPGGTGAGCGCVAGRFAGVEADEFEDGFQVAQAALFCAFQGGFYALQVFPFV